MMQNFGALDVGCPASCEVREDCGDRMMIEVMVIVIHGIDAVALLAPPVVGWTYGASH